MKQSIRLSLVLLLTAGLLSGCDNKNPAASQNPPSTVEAGNSQWEEVRPGINYAMIHLKPDPESDFKDFVVVSIDPKLYSFSVIQNSDQATAKTIKEIHEETGSFLTFNGGFFTEEFKPTGLLISEGKKLRKTSPAGLLNGILAIDDTGNARLFKNTASLNENKYVFAIQNGPVLLDEKGNIGISEDTGKTASRTAVGLDDKGNVILIILKQSLLNADNQMTLYRFAHLLKESPEFAKLDLRATLNLDGGPSTGMMIDDLYFPEMEKVQNVVIVKNRNA